MAEWGCVMGFSGTVQGATQTQFETEFKEAICITIPSLRTGGQCNKVAEAVVEEESLDIHIAKIVPTILMNSNNLIIIFETE